MMRKYGLRNGAQKFSSVLELYTPKGVCILLNPNSSSNFDVIQTDYQGRILISKLKICEEIFFIVNIYAATDYRDQNEFITVRLLEPGHLEES